MRQVSSERRRKFAAELMESAFFGAFLLAIEARKSEQALTRSELGKRMGREKTGISKLLSGPRNWQVDTISDLAEALDVRLEFALVDRLNPLRRFTATGTEFQTFAGWGQSVCPPERGTETQADTKSTIGVFPAVISGSWGINTAVRPLANIDVQTVFVPAKIMPMGLGPDRNVVESADVGAHRMVQSQNLLRPKYQNSVEDIGTHPAPIVSLAG